MTESIRAANLASAQQVPSGASAADHPAERTRLLYRGSRIPAVLLLITTLICVVVLWGERGGIELGVWAGWMAFLGLLRLQQVMTFNRTSSEQQAEPYWRWRFLLGSAAMPSSNCVALMTTSNSGWSSAPPSWPGLPRSWAKARRD